MGGCISHADFLITKLNHYQDTKLNLSLSRRYFNISSLFCSYRSLLYIYIHLQVFWVLVPLHTVKSASLIMKPSKGGRAGRSGGEFWGGGGVGWSRFPKQCPLVQAKFFKSPLYMVTLYSKYTIRSPLYVVTLYSKYAVRSSMYGDFVQ